MALDEIVKEPAAAAAQPAAPPRKRRRRAPATGATEDCFTCRKRKTQCDRRRPYCTQCIELGKECSGYRTTLTWGVGVASRGKLRGKSLPVANSPKASAPVQKQSADITSPTLANSVRSASTISEVDVKQELGSPSATVASYQNTPLLDPQRSVPQCSSPTAMSAVSMAPSANPNFNYAAPNFHEPLDGYYGVPAKPSRTNFRPRPLQRLQTHFAGMYDDPSMSAPSTGSVSAFSDGDFPSPIEYPQTPDEMHFADSMVNSFPDPYTGHHHHHHHQGRSSSGHIFMDVPRSYPSGPSEDLSSSLGSDFGGTDHSAMSPALSSVYGFGPSTPDSYHQEVASPHVVPEGFDYVFGPQPQPVRNSAVTSHPHEDAADVPFSSSCAPSSTAATSLPKSLDTSPFRHLSLRARSLMEYYDRMICPFLVAFDGPANPYRMYILHLGVSNEGLQNAIGALATNNIRMRQMNELNGSEFCRPVLEIEKAKTPASSEEQHYRQKAIASLNSQLANTTQARHDSVLATLLILCLFHVCDSGFSKFKTQLAGVQKLLRMRSNDRATRSESRSGFLDWVEMFFTWFDVMNSTVNDRETEVRGDSLDMVDLSANLGALEHLAGCEGRLFKLIARLGRLNLLSQERPVRDEPEESTSSPISPKKRNLSEDDDTPRPTPKMAKLSLDASRFDFNNLDGNGWGSTISSSTPTPVPGTPTLAMRAAIAPDSRHAFWKEWNRIRARLESWTFATPIPPLSVDVDAMNLDVPHPDVGHISRAFHAAALLYTERLSSPSLPPAAPSIQVHVRATLGHIANLAPDSCMLKFLLWPLFIAGTECVEWGDRGMIRERIVGITKESGFFNNMAGLGVLESVWAEDDRVTAEEAVPAGDGDGEGEGDRPRQAFRWRKVMDRVQGEYIVV